MSGISETIGRVRRAMPRNADVMAICDDLEERLACRSAVDRLVPPRPKLTRAEIQRNYRLRKKNRK